MYRTSHIARVSRVASVMAGIVMALSVTTFSQDFKVTEVSLTATPLNY